MTGAFTVKGEKRHKFVKFKVGEDWPPRFAKLELQMSNGACLALTDPRRLARVRLRVEPEASPPISLLGPDPLTDPLSLETFAAALVKPTAPIKAVLLAQDRVVSGVGNWVADEVCFQAFVHPGAACNTLAPEQVAALHAKLLSVCREACEARADYTAFPKAWLFHHSRWGKGKGAEGAPRVSSGHPIIFDVVGGRTTAIVPAVQKKGLLHPSAATAARGGGGPSSSASGRKPRPSSGPGVKPEATASGGGDGKKGRVKAGRKNKKEGVGIKEKAEEEQDKADSVTDERDMSSEIKQATKNGRRASAAGDVASVKKKGGEGKRSLSPTEPADRAGGSSSTKPGGVKGKKTTTVTHAGDHKVKVKPIARRSKKANVITVATGPAAPKRGRGGENGTGTAAAMAGAVVMKGKRAKTSRAVVKSEHVAMAGGGDDASAKTSKGSRAAMPPRAAGRRSPRLLSR
ncbi:unnamed protein product [Hapterophycus canaliculatus]